MPDSLFIRDEQIPTKSAVRKGDRPRKASSCVETKTQLPTGAPISETPREAAGGGQVACDIQSITASPTTDTTAAVLDAGGGGEVRAISNVATTNVLPDLALVVEELQALQSKRLYYMLSVMAPRNRTLARMRYLLDWGHDNTEAQNKKIQKRAAQIVAYVEAKDDAAVAVKALRELPDTATKAERRALESDLKTANTAMGKIKLSFADEMEAIACAPFIEAELPSKRAFEKLIAQAEKEMKTLARKLPIFMWSQGVRGLGEIGIATIVGETGDLSVTPTKEGVQGYATHERVWKRLGLAVINGRRQGAPGPGATKDDWIEHGYRALRRSQCWKINDSLIRAQWRGAKEDDDTGEITAGYALGPYGELYARQKAEEHRRNDAGEYAAAAAQIVDDCKARRAKPHPENLAGRLTKKHLDNKARRIVEKQLIEDLWREWNRPRQEFA